jgi:endonuclease-8
VFARGKHLVIALSGDLFLHTHMRMNGSWHVYPTGERWRRPVRDMRVLIETPRAVAVGFNIPVAEFLTSREMVRHPQLRALGPDLLGPQFDRAEALRRLTERPNVTIADALLDQRAVAGIGNVFKSEVLFATGVYPFSPVRELRTNTLQAILDTAGHQLRLNVGTRPGWPTGPSRWTTGSLDPAKKLWVYGRGGKPCRRCGSPIRANKTGPHARLTYWCPRCQPPSRSAD